MPDARSKTVRAHLFDTLHMIRICHYLQSAAVKQEFGLQMKLSVYCLIFTPVLIYGHEYSIVTERISYRQQKLGSFAGLLCWVAFVIGEELSNQEVP